MQKALYFIHESAKTQWEISTFTILQRCFCVVAMSFEGFEQALLKAKTIFDLNAVFIIDDD